MDISDILLSDSAQAAGWRVKEDEEFVYLYKEGIMVSVFNATTCTKQDIIAATK